MKKNRFGYWHMIYDQVSPEDHLPSTIKILESEYTLFCPENKNEFKLYQWYDETREEYSDGFFLSKEAAATDIYDWIQDNP